MAIPLCVPFEQKSVAYKAGARWNKEQKLWECDPAILHTAAYEQLRPFVPLMYRPDRPPPHIRPMMIPQTSWGKNLRSVLTKENWDKVRKQVYAAAGYRCRICGGKGNEWPVEANELWSYDDEKLIQKLVNVIANCPTCHMIHHWGKTTISGKADIALAQMMHVNGWSSEQAEKAGDDGFKEWERRSRNNWTLDYSWAVTRFGVSIEADAEAREDEANQTLVSLAKANYEKNNLTISLVFKEPDWSENHKTSVLKNGIFSFLSNGRVVKLYIRDCHYHFGLFQEVSSSSSSPSVNSVIR